MATWKFISFNRLFTLCKLPNGSANFKIHSHRIFSSNINRKILTEGPGLKEFLIAGEKPDKYEIATDLTIPYLRPVDYNGNNRKVYFEVYGCQMNVNDTEIVWSILKNVGYKKVDTILEADIILIITCSIREGAESKIWHRLRHFAAMKFDRGKKKGPLQVGVLGCMAERLKVQLLEKEKSVDLVAGPDSYQDLPRLLAITKNGLSAVNVLLSLDETYADIMPVRLTEGSVTAFVSIMRGCDNMCSYCIVPFTRGRERSRPIKSIEHEVQELASQGVKEITLLGQNVNSYRDLTVTNEMQLNHSSKSSIASGFKTVYKPKIGGARFAALLDRVACAIPQTRVRFTSPHPKDFSDDVLNVINMHGNICKSIHLPVQSGSTTVLERMRRGYTRETYLTLVDHIRTKIPHIALSSDFICGFCGETDEEFAETISLMKQVKFNVAYLFQYSMREKTTAHRRYKDDVPLEVKNLRLKEMVRAYRDGATEMNNSFVGSEQIILIEGPSKRSMDELYGRNDSNIKVIIPAGRIPIGKDVQNSELDVNKEFVKAGDFVYVEIIASNSQTLKGTPLYHTHL